MFNNISFLVISLLVGFSAHAQTQPNYFNYTDAQINHPSGGIKTAYAVGVYVEERTSFEEALTNYFLVSRNQDYMSFSMVSYTRIQEGIWWETTAAKRKTIYTLNFEVRAGGNPVYDKCKMNFERSEGQGTSTSVKPVVSSKKCVKASSR